VPTNSEKKGRASDPFLLLDLLMVGQLNVQLLSFSSDFGSYRSALGLLPLCGRANQRIAFLAHPNPCGLW